MHSLPYREEITEDVYGDLFKDVGRNEDGVQSYFSSRATRLDKSPVLAFDSTTISTYSENQLEARRGFNKDGDGLNTIKLLTLYSVKDREPLAFAEAKKYFGYFTLVTPQAMNTFTALENYRLREKIEELFGVQKGGLDGARPRTWYPDNLRGRQCVQFVSLGYHCFLTKKIKEVRDSLGKSKALVKLEKKLDKWLEQRSLPQILDWFDCIEATNVQTAMDNYR